MPFLPYKDGHLEAFKESLYTEPFGERALGKAFLAGNPDLPETAGWDATDLGKSAIIATAGIRNAADEMALTAQQAQAVARNTRVASLRAYEALKSYHELFRREGLCSEALKAGKGPVPTGMYAAPSSFLENGMPTTFLQVPTKCTKAACRGHAFLSSTPTTFMAAVPGVPKAPKVMVGPHYDTSWCKAKPPVRIKAGKGGPLEKMFGGGDDGDLPGGLPSGPPGMPGEEEEKVDLDSGWFLKRDLENAFAFLRQASIDATKTADAITKEYLRVRHASRAITEALKLPGEPVPPPIPPVMLKPPKRPRDLSPFWLDVPYGIQSGADPYSPGTDGAPRDSAAETFVGVPGFNPFEGNVPFSEAGLTGAYKSVGYASNGGKIDPGIHVPSKMEAGMIEAKEMANDAEQMASDTRDSGGANIAKAATS